MKVLGIDPSTKSTGYAIYDTESDTILKSGVILALESLNWIKRINYMGKQITALYEAYGCDKLNLENVPNIKSIEVTRKLFCLQGVILSSLVGEGICNDCELYLPKQWRRHYGIASLKRKEAKAKAMELAGVNNEDEAEAILISKI